MKKPINIFYAVQVSNYTITSNGPKWLIRNDACTNIAVGIISTLLDKNDNYRFLIKLPDEKFCSDCENLYALFLPKYHDRIDFLRSNIPISPITSRYHFDITEFESKAGLFKKMDVMINDENTLTKNWNVLFKHIGANIPIMSTNYFLDSPIANKVDEKIRYYERQMESFINSDIAVFQCEAGKNEAMEAYDMLFKSRKHIKQTSVWGVGCHAQEIINNHTNEEFPTPTIYFGNRISDTANRYTNYDSFAEAIGKLSKITNKKFNAVMLNPTRKVTESQLKEIDTLSNGCVRVLSNDKSFTRKEYLQFINKAHISVNLFVTEVHGGVTHCEAMLAKNVLIVPNVNNYKTKFEKCPERYPFLVDAGHSKPNTDQIAEKLSDALDLYYEDREEFDRLGEVCFGLGYKYESYESACDRISNDIDSLTNVKQYVDAII
jgi:hypothetical protein